MCMEVWRCVAAFIPVHVDRDSSEVADPRHAPMLTLMHLSAWPRSRFRTKLTQTTRREDAVDKSLISNSFREHTAIAKAGRLLDDPSLLTHLRAATRCRPLSGSGCFRHGRPLSNTIARSGHRSSTGGVA